VHLVGRQVELIGGLLDVLVCLEALPQSLGADALDGRTAERRSGVMRIGERGSSSGRQAAAKFSSLQVTRSTKALDGGVRMSCPRTSAMRQYSASRPACS